MIKVDVEVIGAVMAGVDADFFERFEREESAKTSPTTGRRLGRRASAFAPAPMRRYDTFS